MRVDSSDLHLLLPACGRGIRAFSRKFRVSGPLREVSWREGILVLPLGAQVIGPAPPTLSRKQGDGKEGALSPSALHPPPRAGKRPSPTMPVLICGGLAERGLVAADRIEKFFAIELELHCADAVYGGYLLQRHGLTARHFEEAAVRQNHIGWDRLRLGQRRAASTERVG